MKKMTTIWAKRAIVVLALSLCSPLLQWLGIIEHIKWLCLTPCCQYCVTTSTYRAKIMNKIAGRREKSDVQEERKLLIWCDFLRRGGGEVDVPVPSSKSHQFVPRLLAIFRRLEQWNDWLLLSFVGVSLYSGSCDSPAVSYTHLTLPTRSTV